MLPRRLWTCTITQPGVRPHAPIQWRRLTETMGMRLSKKARRVDPVPGRPIVEAGAILSIIDVCQDPDLFGPWFKGPSWVAWFVFLKTMFALPLDAAELALFK